MSLLRRVSAERKAIEPPPRWMGFVDHGSILVLNHPDAIRHVLQDNHAAYIKGVLYDDLRRLLGDGLLTVDDDSWLGRRKAAQPAFHAASIEAYHAVMVDTIAAFLRQWKARARPGRAVDIFPELSRLTLRVIATTLFGLDLQQREHVITGALNEFVTFDNRSRGPVLGRVYKYLPFWAKMRAYQARNALEDSITWIIENRSGPRDVISYIVEGLPDAEEPSKSRRVRDEVATILIAGHETSAVALVWAFHLLSQNPDAERTLRRELAEVLGARSPVPADMPRLTYTTMVVKETLRLYPPVPTIARQAIQDDVIAGYRIPANTRLRVKPALIHRHPDFWPNPEQFRPERFSPEQSAARPQHAFIPFGAGPRTCIGNQFAMMEMKLAVAMILQSLHLNPARNRPPVGVVSNVTLRPRFGMWMIPEFSSGVE